MENEFFEVDKPEYDFYNEPEDDAVIDCYEYIMYRHSLAYRFVRFLSEEN